MVAKLSDTVDTTVKNFKISELEMHEKAVATEHRLAIVEKELKEMCERFRNEDDAEADSNDEAQSNAQSNSDSPVSDFNFITSYKLICTNYILYRTLLICLLYFSVMVNA